MPTTPGGRRPGGQQPPYQRRELAGTGQTGQMGAQQGNAPQQSYAPQQYMPRRGAAPSARPQSAGPARGGYPPSGAYPAGRPSYGGQGAGYDEPGYAPPYEQNSYAQGYAEYPQGYAAPGQDSYTPGYAPDYGAPGYGSDYGAPGYDPNYGPGYDANYAPGFDQGYAPGYGEPAYGYDQGYDPSYDPAYGDPYAADGMGYDPYAPGYDEQAGYAQQGYSADYGPDYGAPGYDDAPYEEAGDWGADDNYQRMPAQQDDLFAAFEMGDDEQDVYDDFDAEDGGHRNVNRTSGGKGGKGGKKSGKKRRNGIIAACLSGVLVLGLAGTVLLFVLRDKGVSSVSSSLVSTQSQRYANLVNASLYPDTVLPAGADAGESYLQETLFVGDSNTLAFVTASSVGGISGQNVIALDGLGAQYLNSLACVGFEGEEDLLTIPQAVKVLQPRRIIITIGTNNAGEGMDLDSFISNYRAAVSAMQGQYSYAEIIIAAVPPVGENRANTSITLANIEQMNFRLVDMAKEMGVKFLNWAEVLVDDSTGYCRSEYIQSDGIHLNSTGLGVMADYARTHPDTTEDRRPADRDEIPQRTSVPSDLITPTDSSSSSSGATSRSTASSSSSVPSSSSSSSSQEQDGKIDVQFVAVIGSASGARGGGTINVGGTVGADVRVTGMQGYEVENAVAIPADGYEFDYWACNIGSLNQNGVNSGRFMVPGNAKSVVEVVVIYAVFKVATPAPTPTP